MSHPIYHIPAVQIAGPYTLRLQFDDGLQRTIDFDPLLRGELFAPLRDLALFNQVRLDPETQTIVWPNGADFDPATLHDAPNTLPTYPAPTQQPAVLRETKPESSQDPNA